MLTVVRFVQLRNAPSPMVVTPSGILMDFRFEHSPKEKKDFKENLRKLNESDNKIIAAKSFYNKNTSNLNSLIKNI